jgi:type II secretory pathway component PulF
VLFLLVMFPGIEEMLRVYILPKFEEMFHEYAVSPHIFFFPRSFFFCAARIGIAVATLVLVYLLLRYTGIRLGKAGYYVPIVGRCARDYNLSYFLRTFSWFLRRLKRLGEALRLTAQAMPYYEYAAGASAAAADVEQGKALSQSLPEGILFPPTARLLIRSGELSGTLDTNLEQAADYYYTRYIRRSQMMWRVALPLVVLWAGIIAGTYAYVVFSLLRALFESQLTA